MQDTDEVIEAGQLSVPVSYDKPQSMVLINGKGGGSREGQEFCNDTLSVLYVEPGKTYRLRVIGANGNSHPTIGIEGHPDLTIIEADGYALFYSPFPPSHSSTPTWLLLPLLQFDFFPLFPMTLLSLIIHPLRSIPFILFSQIVDHDFNSPCYLSTALPFNALLPGSLFPSHFLKSHLPPLSYLPQHIGFRLSLFPNLTLHLYILIDFTPLSLLPTY